MGVFLRHVAGMATVLAAAAPAVARQAPADIVFTNGYVYSVDSKDHVFQALAVRGGRIVYIGDDGGAASYAGPKTRRIDLKGHMMMPGLVDGHMHPLEGGQNLIGCSLDYLPLTVGGFSDRVRACAADPSFRNTSGGLVVRNWFQEAMKPVGTRLTKQVLDAIDATHPIVVRSSFGHSALLNSAALRLAGITATTQAPPGGEIVHDAAGQPTGMLEDEAQNLIAPVDPPSTPQEDVRAAAASLAAMRAQGVTGFLDAWALDKDLAAYAALQRQGALTARAHFAPLVDPAHAADIAGNVGRLKAIAARYDQGPIGVAPSVTVRNVKLFMDGVITAPAMTGVLLAPYRVNRGTAAAPRWEPGPSSGPAPYFPPAVLGPLLQGLVTAGFDPHMHADGDGAVRIALDGVQAMRAALPQADARPAIAHDELVDPADRPRFKALGAVPVLSFQWEKQAPDTVEGARDYLGPDRVRDIEPASLLAQAGARIAYGSDWPVDPLNEWFALKVGVTRTNAPEAGPRYAHPLGDEPGLSRAEVLRAITMNSSWELRSDTQTGSLEPGKLADLIVLDRNVMQVPANDIANTKVLVTMVGGRIVYSTGALAPKANGPG
ncbi:amidohydrolase [Gluconacetobacter azotocaptans]|uniref:Amidohydrolase n=1 Tax=Gluconacetobacter azotocaptans TaxID=142834 RepID=A0A7W4JQ42_9PROT|nr:amidohydrolase [Gluconacetobacter azotocaptans]MBB2188828.1 amidohydrolase [Gluconacetobacter azotocaptans]GBQ31161.1 putative metal-dependent hydrolase [Gluconacetobacter azotocaptans DSM 13594]